MTIEAKSARSHLEGLVARYVPKVGSYDEMMDANGTIRPHWRTVITQIADLEPGARTALGSGLNRRVREIGIAHDIFAEPGTSRQPWRVNLVPLVISADEWSWLEKALSQRARLLNAVLGDVYGRQRLLADGLIPAELVFSAPTYLRACQGIIPERGHLQFYAADLARAADGSWRVIDNHAETPAGTGYALANRIVHSRVAGDMFARANAVRLAAFFREMQGTLIAQTGRANPRIVLLTPGPHHGDYFSHAYLARYLGFELAEGSDLRVAGDEVYLKTLEGLRGVDLIVRCTEGARCDPLELNPQAFDGPGGFVQACRTTSRLVVNALGTAFVEHRGLGRYLPGLCQHLFGERLLLPDAPRWWLGEPDAQARVLSAPEGYAIRAACEGTGRPGSAALATRLTDLSAADRAQLLAEIQFHGDGLVAEEKMGFGTLPTWTPEGLAPEAFAVRLFASATPDGYRLMPGGLAMKIDASRSVALNAPDGDTRDVWVLSDTTVAPHVSLWRPAVDTARVQRSQRDLQSRVADNLFWLGRYVERADWTMRVIRSSLIRQQVDGALPGSQRAAYLCLQALTSKDVRAKAYQSTYITGEAVEALARQLATPQGGDFNVARTLEGVHRLASLTRDRLSLEAWRTLNTFRSDEGFRRPGFAGNLSETVELIDEGLLAIAAFNGLMHENMTRNFGWSFLDMGRRLERAMGLSEAVGALFCGATALQERDDEEEGHRLMFLLELADSFITYRSRYRLDPMIPLVLDLLLIDDTNPRSLVFQLAALAEHLASLPKAQAGTSLPEERRLVLGLHAQVRLADAQVLAQRSERGSRDKLNILMHDQQRVLPDVCTAIMRRYFSLKDDQPHRVHTRARTTP